MTVGKSQNRSKRPAMQDRLKRLKFRAWHRGTREADYMIGGFFDRYSPGWSDEDIAWFEAVCDEDDVDIMGWALGTGAPPLHHARPALLAAPPRTAYIPPPSPALPPQFSP